ncbi:MAG: tyrosine-protein phosphatase [Clostridiales bacterium]|nr:tyrosine-protein phosphatase [Clostridiales bacterium]
MKQFSRFLALALALCLCLGLTPVLAEDAPITVTEIQKYGNMVLSVSGSDLLSRGFAYGDGVTVTVNGQSYEMALGSNFSDVEQGSMILRVVIKPETNEDYALIAINMGDLATTAGVATKEKTEADPGYVWHYNEGVEVPVTVTVELTKPGAYYDSWLMNQLVRSENREDYPELTDAEYANFRAVTTNGVGANKLYRSSSPVNPEINRNKQADAAAREAGIRTFINLADNDQVMRGYEGFDESYYSGQSIIALNLGVDFSAEDFRLGLADGVRFIAAGEAPFLVHCNEGKDRAGFVSAVLECLMGASAEEVTADYMVTFYNYYGVEAGTEQYAAIAKANIQKSLAAAFELDTIEGANLAEEAREYLLAIGVSEEDIAAAKAKLGE